MEVNHSLNQKLARVRDTLAHIIAAPGQLPPVPSSEQTDTADNIGFARQCSLAGDPLDDKQWGDDLKHVVLLNSFHEGYGRKMART